MGKENGTASMENSSTVSYKETNYETIPAVVPPGIYLREKKTVHTKACTQVFLAVLCTMANNRKQPDFLQQVNS